MATYDPSNGNGGYFQHIGVVRESQEQRQVVVLLDQGIGVYQGAAHRQVADDALSVHFDSFDSQP